MYGIWEAGTYVEMSGKEGGDRSTICTLWTRFEPRTAWHFWYGRWQGCEGYFLVWLRAIVE